MNAHSDDTRIDFFISRAGADSAFADRIGRILENAGFRVFLQQWDFKNHNFVERMNTALGSGARTIALLSPEYMKSDACRAEWLTTLGNDVLNRNGRLLVFRVVECKPTELLSAIAYSDLVPVRDDPQAIERIVLEVVTSDRRKGEDALGAHWRIPKVVLHPQIRAVPDFAGRQDLLDAIDSILWPVASASRREPVALTGMGGVGKSVLARQFAWLNRERYAGIWWVPAENEGSLHEALRSLGATFEPSLTEMDDPAEAARLSLGLLAKLGEAKPWLLIYDNAETPEAIQSWLPGSGAQAIVSTRWRDWEGLAASVPVDVLPTQVAAGYLLNRAGSSDEGAAAALAADLGCLPLALDHAGAYCRHTKTSLAEYRANAGELIKTAPQRVAYPASVYATFRLAIDKANQIHEKASFLGFTLAYMAPDDIPLDLFKSLETFMGEKNFGGALTALTDVSLIEAVPSQWSRHRIVSMHRVVQQVARSYAEEVNNARGAAVSAAIQLSQSFPEIGNPRNWPDCARLLPHSLTALECLPQTGEDSEPRAELHNLVASFLFERGDYRGAEAHFRNALTIAEGCFGPAAQESIAIRGNLGGLLSRLGEIDAAGQLLRDNLAALEKAHGADSLELINALVTLGNHLRENEEAPEKALEMMRRALSIIEKVPEIDHQPAIAVLNGLGIALNGLERWAEAETYLRKALDIGERALPPNDPEIARLCSNLGVSVKNSSLEPANAARLREAERLMRRSITITEKIYGPDHPLLATRLFNLSELLPYVREFGEAARLGLRALDIAIDAYGAADRRVMQQRMALMVKAHVVKEMNELSPDNPEHLHWWRLVAALSEAAGAFGGTLRAESKAVVERLSAGSNGDSPVRSEPVDLVALREEPHRLAEIEPDLRQMVSHFEEQGEQGHDQLSRLLHDYAALLHLNGRNDEAEVLFRRSLSLCQALHGEKDLRTGGTMAFLGWVVSQLGRYAEAEKLLMDAALIHGMAHGDDHESTKQVLSMASRNAELAQEHDPERFRLNGTTSDVRPSPVSPTAQAMKSLSISAADIQKMWQDGRQLHDDGKFEEAERTYRLALAAAESTLGPDNEAVANIGNSLAILLKHFRRYEEAEPYLRKSHAMTERHRGTFDPEVAITAGNLATLLVRKKKPDVVEAEALARRALDIDVRARSAPRMIIRDHMNLSEVLAIADKTLEAVEAGRTAWKMCCEAFGEDDENSRYVRKRLDLLEGLHASTSPPPAAGNDAATSEPSTQAPVIAEDAKAEPVAAYSALPTSRSRIQAPLASMPLVNRAVEVGRQLRLGEGRDFERYMKEHGVKQSAEAALRDSLARQKRIEEIRYVLGTKAQFWDETSRAKLLEELKTLTDIPSEEDAGAGKRMLIVLAFLATGAAAAWYLWQ